MAPSDIARLVALQDIRDLTARYAQCVIRADIHGLVACFSAEGIYDTEASLVQGASALLANFERVLVPCHTVPFTSNHLIELHSATVASATLQMMTPWRGAAAGFVAYYEDRLVIESGSWKFAHRRFRTYKQPTG